MSKTNPYAIRRDGQVIDNLDWQNASEQVQNYGAEWINPDAAVTAISAQRAAQRAQMTINAEDVT